MKTKDVWDHSSSFWLVLSTEGVVEGGFGFSEKKQQQKNLFFYFTLLTNFFFFQF